MQKNLKNSYFFKMVDFRFFYARMNIIVVFVHPINSTREFGTGSYSKVTVH